VTDEAFYEALDQASRAIEAGADPVDALAELDEARYVDGDGVTRHGPDPATFPRVRPLARKVNRQPGTDDLPRPIPEHPTPITGGPTDG
jgi:hypothetical protein